MSVDPKRARVLALVRAAVILLERDRVPAAAACLRTATLFLELPASR